MTLEELQDELKKLGEIYSGIKITASEYTSYYNNHTSSYLRVDKVKPTHKWDKNNYIINRFRFRTVKLDEMTNKKIASIHKQFVKRCIQINKEYEFVEKFIKENINFKYDNVVIYNRSIVFTISHKYVNVSNTKIIITYKVNSKGDIVIINNKNVETINAGQIFIDMQKKIAEDAVEEFKNKNKELWKKSENFTD